MARFRSCQRPEVRYWGLGTGLPVRTAIRSFIPSDSTRVLTLLGSPEAGSINITLETWIGASDVMIPPSGLLWVGRSWRFLMFTPSTHDPVRVGQNPEDSALRVPMVCLG